MSEQTLLDKVKDGGAWAYAKPGALVAHWFLARNHHSRLAIAYCFKVLADQNDLWIDQAFGKCPHCESLLIANRAKGGDSPTPT